nr:reverse transcriptase domain-containing protein [Blautia pseudococcoides]
MLSPLLSNIVLNELDWWVTSQWEGMKTRKEFTKYICPNGTVSDNGRIKSLRKFSNLKECYIVRYADDFKVFCRNYEDARCMFIAIRKWLKDRLDLSISEEKSKIVNLRKNYSEFLGFRLKVRKKGKKRVVTSHISQKAKERIKVEVKELVKDLQNPKDMEESYRKVCRYNAYILGVHNYYRYATNIQEDLDPIAFNIRKNLEIRLRTRLTKSTRRMVPRYIAVRYGDSKQLRFVDGLPVAPLGYVQHKSPMYKPKAVNNYTKEGRALIHRNIRTVSADKIEYLMQHPIPGATIEMNDNRLSLYVAQQGKCFVSGVELDVKNCVLHRKRNLPAGMRDKYQNLVLVIPQVKNLISLEGAEPEIYRKAVEKLKLDKKALEKLNRLRRFRNREQIAMSVIC